MAAETDGDLLYVIQLQKRGGTALRRVRFEPNWHSAREWAWFQGVRRHGAGFCQPGDGRVVPRWHPETGPPYVSGFDITFPVNGAGESHGMGIEYWRPLARALSSPLVKEGLLEAGETFTYRIEAYTGRAEVEAEEAQGFAVREVPTELPLRPGRLAEAVTGASFIGPAEASDFPLLLLPEVLLDAAELRAQHPDIESGGVLLGHLYHDPSVPDVFGVVTALVPFPVEHTVATAASLRITPEAWMAASAAIALRGRGEMVLGWEHHHPNRAWQDAETDPADAGDAAFFSGADVDVMAATFPQPWSAALVVSDTALADGGWATRFTLFGWRQSVVVERGFHLVAEELAETLAMGETSHVTTTGT